MPRLLPGALALLPILVPGCTRTGETPSATRNAAATGVEFVEGRDAAGIQFRHTDGSSGKYFIVETLASGVILFDLDDDGRLDIYFPNGRPLPPTPEGNASQANALYLNEGGGKFRDVTREKGVPGTGFGTGGAAADYDGDGDLDLYVCQFGPNVLYRNEGKGKGFAFTDVTRASGADDPRFSAGAAFFDMDRDGDLDLYVTNYCKTDLATDKPCYQGPTPRYCAPSVYQPEGDSLFLNLGDGAFRDVTLESGVGAITQGRGMGVVATDFDRDGWMDVYVANDGSDNFLLRNLGNGKLTDVALTVGVALNANGDELGSMGVDAGDFNRDGRLDIIVTAFQKQLNALFRNQGNGFYADVAMAHGLGETCLPMVSWGTKFFDLDNDGWLDIFIANGHLEDHVDKYDQSTTFLQQCQVFHNAGEGAFKEVSNDLGEALKVRRSSRGAAFGDLDLDGDVDIVVCNSRDRPSLLVNEGGDRRSWIILDLRGRKNRFGVGAFVKVTPGQITQVAEVHSGSSYISQNDLRLHFGLGEAAKVDLVEVDWPEGLKESFRDLEARKLHRLEEGTGQKLEGSR